MYYNAYRVPHNYRPKSETERALQESLRDMKLQCEERVDLLMAIERSREEAQAGGDIPRTVGTRTLRDRVQLPNKSEKEPSNIVAVGTEIGMATASVAYPELTKLQAPSLPSRPSVLQKNGSETSVERSQSSPQIPKSAPEMSFAPVTLIPPRRSRTPSPEKRNRMLTTLRGIKGTKDGKKPSRSLRSSSEQNPGQPVASKAAGLAWDSISRSSGQRLGQSLSTQGSSTVTLDSLNRNGLQESSTVRRASAVKAGIEDRSVGNNGKPPPTPGPPNPFDYQILPNSHHEEITQQVQNRLASLSLASADLEPSGQPIPPQYQTGVGDNGSMKFQLKSPEPPTVQPDFISYRNEYPSTPPSKQSIAQFSARKSPNAGNSTLPLRQRSPDKKPQARAPSNLSRRPVANTPFPPGKLQLVNELTKPEISIGSSKTESFTVAPQGEASQDSPSLQPAATTLGHRVNHFKKHLPKGVDENAAKQIFNEIVVQGDEVHWDDVAGLDIAKKALKEAVVYPFLRPDLFMGLREPARGMLLFGPPGTGKTMLARAVATESKSTFFAISASSLTSKWLGESEKLVRALFTLAKALAPSIIFVDEIDSLLSSRGGATEHESTRRVKTEFLIQWSDLQRAAAGKAQTDKEKQEGDASRVLVLAATNLPWAIDEAARRRFVRRQYIPLPEGHVRATQLRTLLSHQKHNLREDEIEALVKLTDGMCLIWAPSKFMTADEGFG